MRVRSVGHEQWGGRLGKTSEVEEQAGGETRDLREGLKLTPVTLKLRLSSVAQSCPTFCNPMGCSMQGFPVLHQLLEFTQTRVH